MRKKLIELRVSLLEKENEIQKLLRVSDNLEKLLLKEQQRADELDALVYSLSEQLNKNQKE